MAAETGSDGGPTEFSRDRRASTRTQLKNKVVGLGYGSTSRKTFYKRLFGKYDVEGDMKLGLQEFMNFLKSQHGNINEAEAKVVMAKMDSDNSGDIDFEEFLAFVGVGGDDGATSDKQALVTRSLPIQPVDQLSWCLSRMAERKNLTFVMVCVNKLFTSLTPMQLINAGVMLELWGIVTEYNNIDKDRGEANQTIGCAQAAHKLSVSESMEYNEDDQGTEGSYVKSSNARATTSISVVQREAAIDLMERLSVVLPPNEKKGLKLPPPDELVRELHLRTVRFILDRIEQRKGPGDTEVPAEVDGSLTLEERIAQMKLEMEKTMIQEDLGSAAAIEHQADIDHEEVLFLLRGIRCQRSQISADTQFMLLESCILLAGEVLVEGLPPFPKAHVLAARSLLGGFSLRSFYVMFKAAQHVEQRPSAPASKSQRMFLSAIGASASLEIERLKKLNFKRRDRAQTRNKEALQKENKEKSKKDQLELLEQQRRARIKSVPEREVELREAKRQEDLEKENKERLKKEQLELLDQQRRARVNSVPERDSKQKEAKRQEAIAKENKERSKKEQLEQLKKQQRRARVNSALKRKEKEVQELPRIKEETAQLAQIEKEELVFKSWLQRKQSYKSQTIKVDTKRRSSPTKRKKKKKRLLQFTQDVYNMRANHHHIRLTFGADGRPSRVMSKATESVAKSNVTSAIPKSPKLPRVTRTKSSDNLVSHRPTSSPIQSRRRLQSVTRVLRAASLLHAAEEESRSAAKRNKSMKLKPLVW